MDEAKLEKALQSWRAVAKEHAEAKGQRTELDHMRKVVKAQLMVSAEQLDPQKYKSAASQEVYAYSHPDYITCIKGLSAATEAEALYYWRLKIAEKYMDMQRTMAASDRAERRAYGA